MNKAMVFLVGMLLVAAGPASADGTAKEGLPAALQKAGTWQPDAKLTRIGATKADARGKALVWQYDFLSPKKKECYRVVLMKGTVWSATALGACTPDKPVSTEFVDSPVAMEQAKKNGFQPMEENNMYLSRSKDRLAKGKECWTVHTISDFDPAKAVMRGWCVDAKTGTFFLRLSGETGK